MAKKKTTKKKTTDKKRADEIVEEEIIEEPVFDIVEEELLPLPEPEEMPEAEEVVITSEEAPESIEVRYFGYRGKGLIHGGRANEQEYHFSGKGSVTITNPIDIAFFRMKAEKNPTKWKVI